jgi:hypothetical protein
MVDCGLDGCHIGSGNARLGIEDKKATVQVYDCSEHSRWMVDATTSVFEDGLIVLLDKVG